MLLATYQGTFSLSKEGSGHWEGTHLMDDVQRLNPTTNIAKSATTAPEFPRYPIAQVGFNSLAFAFSNVSLSIWANRTYRHELSLLLLCAGANSQHRRPLPLLHTRQSLKYCSRCPSSLSLPRRLPSSIHLGGETCQLGQSWVWSWVVALLPIEFLCRSAKHGTPRD